MSEPSAQAGADHFFLKPVDGEQLRILLLQTIEKRALQYEGQWLLEQVENRSAFFGLIGGSDAMRNGGSMAWVSCPKPA
jgi:DNA-binding NtrC family response regulator